MTTLFEQQGGQYEMKGDYKLPCVALLQDTNDDIGVWGERHRRYLKANHRVRYYNLLTAGKLNHYLSDIKQQAEKQKRFICEIEHFSFLVGKDYTFML